VNGETDADNSSAVIALFCPGLRATGRYLGRFASLQIYRIHMLSVIHRRLISCFSLRCNVSLTFRVNDTLIRGADNEYSIPDEAIYERMQQQVIAAASAWGAQSAFD
jgi:hypothetical protein